MRTVGLTLVALGLLLVPVHRDGTRQDRPRPRGHAVIDILDVGQGDAILIRSPEGKAALIDAGPSKDIVALLGDRGVTSIDLVVVSHHHADHYGGMDDVIRAFRPRVFLATDSSHTTPNYLKLLQLVRDSGMQAIFPADTPRKVELGSVVLTVLPQPPEDKAEENNNSIGIRVQHGSFSILLTGDSEARERAYWEANCPELIRDCDVLKLAHHGSRNGTDARWLGLVRPELAVASLGAGERVRPSPRPDLGPARPAAHPAAADGPGRHHRVGRATARSGRSSLADEPARGPPPKAVEAGRRGQEGQAEGQGPGLLIEINTASPDGIGVAAGGRPGDRQEDHRG